MSSLKITLEEIAEKLEAAGCSVNRAGSRLYVNSTPNGGKNRYGWLEEGDDGSTGTCENITKRRGEIAALLRA